MAPRQRSPRERLATGIYRDTTGISVVVVLDGQPHERRHPLGTPLRTLQAARKKLHATLLRIRGTVAAPGTLAGDAPAYLAAVASMPSYRTRALYVRRWVEVFGLQRRDTLTPLQIRTQLQAWAVTPRPPRREGGPPRPPLKPETLRHLLKVLRHLYTVLDGRGAPNPARDVPMPPAPAPELRAIPPLAIAHILRQFRTGSKTRARLAVLATTGMGPSEIMRLEPGHIRLADGVVMAMARRKGQGAAARAIPLTTHARLALRAFVRAKAWGRFSPPAMHHGFRRACERAGYGATDWRPYDLRHTFAAYVAAAGDQYAVQAVLGHTTIATTTRYTLGSVDARVWNAVLGPRGPRRGPTE